MGIWIFRYPFGDPGEDEVTKPNKSKKKIKDSRRI